MALSKDTPLPVEVGNEGFIGSIPAAAVRIYDGAAVGCNSSGYGRGFTLGDTFVGHAVGGVDNSAGSAGDKNCKIRRGRYCLRVALSSVAITDVYKGSPVYLTDDATYSLRKGLLCGKVVRYVSSGYAIVEFNTELQVQVLAETILRADMTDNTNTTGYKDFSGSIPKGAIVLGWRASIVTGFSGDTSAAVQVGKSGAVGSLSADTAQSCLTSSTDVGSAAVAATGFMNAATTPRVTVTGAADFTSISAGEMDIRIAYLAPLRAA